MPTEILVNVTGKETRLALMENGQLAELHIDRGVDRGTIVTYVALMIGFAIVTAATPPIAMRASKPGWPGRRAASRRFKNSCRPTAAKRSIKSV